MPHPPRRTLLPFLATFALTIVAALLYHAQIAAAFALQQHSAAKASMMAPALPAAGTYKIDSAHSFTYFGAWHHIVGLVRGRFDKVEGTITVAKDPAECAVDISVDTASISTQIPQRDEDLRGPDFFDVKKFPAMTYRGKGIHPAAGGQWVMDGTLTIRGMSKTVPITFAFKGLFPDTPSNEPARASFHATAETRRGNFGMVRDNLMELGTSATKPDVAIEIDVEADANSPAK